MANKTISIGFKLDDNGQGLKSLTMDATELKKAMGMVVKEADSMKKSFIDFASLTIGIDSIAKTLGEIQGVCDDLSQAYAVQVEAETKLETVMRERMGATDEMIQGIKDLASAQQELGIIGDEVQLAGAQQIATFLESEQALRTLIPAMNDLVAQQKGYNATAGDAVNVGNLIGKVMQGQTSALKRVGITFTEAQQKALEFGTEEEKAAMLADIITANVGHMNQALANTPAGAMKQLANELGDMKERMGEMVKSLQPYITTFNQIFIGLGNIRKITAAIGVLKTEMGKWIQTMMAATKAVNGLSLATQAFAGVAIVATIGYIVQKVREYIGVTQSATSAIKELNKIREDAAAKMAEQEHKIKTLVKIAKDETQSLYDRKKALTEVNSIVDGYNAKLNETTGAYEANEKALKSYMDTLRKSYELEGAKDTIKDLATEKARLTIQKHQIQKEIDNLTTQAPTNNINRATTSGAMVPMAVNTAIDQAGTRTALEGKLDNIDKKLQTTNAKMDEIESIYGGDMYKSESKSYTSDTKGKGNGGGGGKPKPEPAPPKGSVADYENQLKDIEKKIRFEVDPDSIAQLMREKMALEEKIGTLKGKLGIELKQEQALKKAKEFTEKNPLEIKVQLDTEQLQSEAQKMPMVFKKSSVQVRNLEKDLQNISQVCSKAGQAFSQMGQSFDEPVLNIVGIIASAIANMVAGYASASSQSSEMGPWGWLAFSLAGLAELTAMITQVKSISKFANGGIVSGPTMALVGEYPGASNNPEVIAPLNKLRSMIGTPGGAQTVVVGGDIRLRGSDLMIALKNQKVISGASGRRTL